MHTWERGLGKGACSNLCVSECVRAYMGKMSIVCECVHIRNRESNNPNISLSYVNQTGLLCVVYPVDIKSLHM